MATEISDWYDLDNVRNSLGSTYELVNDLDSDTDGYDDVASSTANGGDGFDPFRDFTGTFDGKGHLIKDVVIDRGDENAVGIFGRTDGGTVRNLGVIDVDVTGEGSFADGVGGVIGTVEEGGYTEQVFVSGNVEDAAGDESIGGMIGRDEGETENCYADVDVDGGSAQYVGGLVGGSRDAWIKDSYSLGSVSGGDDSGGAVGYVSSSYLENVYFDDWSTSHSGDGGDEGLSRPDMEGSDAEENMHFDYDNEWYLVEYAETPEIDGEVPAEGGKPVLREVNIQSQVDYQNIDYSTRAIVSGTITLDDDAVESADVLVYNLTLGELVMKGQTDSIGSYEADTARVEGEGDTVFVAIDYDSGEERYGRVVTTVI